MSPKDRVNRRRNGMTNPAAAMAEGRGVAGKRSNATSSDALNVLKKDHATVKALFKEAENLADRAFAARQKVCRQICKELTLHASAEEQIFYPALKAKTKPATESRSDLLEAYEEHALVKGLIAQLEPLDPKDEMYGAKLQVLTDLVTHHVKEEESKMFKEARELLTKGELDQLGEQILAHKGRALA